MQLHIACLICKQHYQASQPPLVYKRIVMYSHKQTIAL